MAIFRGVGGSGDSSDNSFLQEVTAQANAASASASAASASASSASASASSILNLTAATGAAGTEASYNASTGVLTIPRGDAGVDAVVDNASVSAAGAVMDSDFNANGFMKRTGSGSYTVDTNTYLTSHQDISGKADTSGDTFTGDVLFNDGVKAKFGTDSDLAIYHTDGGNSVIEETGEGALVLQTNGSAFAVISDANDYMINATVDGGVVLYHDGETRLSTSSNTVQVSPSINFVVDTDTLFVDSANDRVGINDATPSEALDVVGNIAVSGTVDGVDIATRDGVLTTTTTTADNALPKAGGQMTGNITFSGTQTVDGRDLSVDGAKLDNLLYSRTSDAHLHSYASTSLSTASKTFGKCFSLATPFDCVRFADVQLEVTYNSSTSNNDVLVSLGLVVPSGTPTIHNLGTATQITDSDYPNGYADRWFSVDGDKTHLFSHFCGLADSSSPVSPTYVYSWVYRADLDKTYFNCGIFANSAIGDGDTVYLHPFDWESAGTVIQRTYNMDGTTAYGGLSQTKGFRVKTAYDDSRLEYRVIAREASSTDTASIKNINVVMTDYEV